MPSEPAAQPADAFARDRALSASGLLATFNAAGVIAAADVHVARRLCDVLGEGDDAVRLAMALAVRGPRLGHVHVDLAGIRDTATPEREDDDTVDLSTLPWPGEDWPDRVAVSRMVSDGPLRLEGSRLYLDRYWREERQVAHDLLELNAASTVDEAWLGPAVGRLFDDPSQAAAAAVALRRRLAIIAGGPGTGKTTTVARLLALLFEQAGGEPPLVALTAPTGKAQARLQEAVVEEAERLPVSADVKQHILGLRASTLHRLLGWRPDSRSRFRHDRAQRLPHDVVIVDETSMVSLSQMARLVEAIRPGARLILVGDPDQLASVEAGAVLGDVVDARSGPLAPAIAELQTVHRQDQESTIPLLGRAIADGDADAALALLGAGHPDVLWHTEAELREPAIAAARRIRDAAEAGDGPGALRELAGFRILCAHRHEVGNLVPAAARRPRDRPACRPLPAGAPAARHPQRPRPRPLQRRHRRRGRRGRPRPRPLRARQTDRPVPPAAHRGRLRHDRPQGTGLAVRHRRGRPARPLVAHPHSRAPLHRGHSRPQDAHRRRFRGRDPRGDHDAHRPRLRPPRPADGVLEVAGEPDEHGREHDGSEQAAEPVRAADELLVCPHGERDPDDGVRRGGCGPARDGPEDHRGDGDEQRRVRELDQREARRPATLGPAPGTQVELSGSAWAGRAARSRSRRLSATRQKSSPNGVRWMERRTILAMRTDLIASITSGWASTTW